MFKNLSLILKFCAALLFLLNSQLSFAQKMETVYLNDNDTTSNLYVALIPEKPIQAFLVLLDGLGGSPKNVLQQSALPKYAAQQGILTIIPILKTGALYFGVDTASQNSLQEQLVNIVRRYNLQGKDFYIGGFSIGGSCAVKYAELANQHGNLIKPKAIFAIDAPLDWERYYNGAKRMIRLSAPLQLNSEVSYMIGRIESEMKGTPKTAIANFYQMSPYSFSDTTQQAVKLLVKTPLMLITEPAIQWWLTERGYDLSYTNLQDQIGMANELKRLGNQNVVLVTTTNQGYRKPDNAKHPHSWSIANEIEVLKWLLTVQKN